MPHDTEDPMGLFGEERLPADAEAKRFAETRGALQALVTAVRMKAGIRNQLGLEVNVALSVSERVLRSYPDPSA